MHMRQGPPPRGEALARLKYNLAVFLVLLANRNTTAFTQLLRWLETIPSFGHFSNFVVYWTFSLSMAYFAINALTAAYDIRGSEVPAVTVSRPALGKPAAEAARAAVLSKSSPLTRANPPSPSIPLFPQVDGSPLRQSTARHAEGRKVLDVSSPSPSLRQTLQRSSQTSPSLRAGPTTLLAGRTNKQAVSAVFPSRSRGSVADAAILAYRGRHDPEGLSRSTSSRRG